MPLTALVNKRSAKFWHECVCSLLHGLQASVGFSCRCLPKTIHCELEASIAFLFCFIPSRCAHQFHACRDLLFATLCTVSYSVYPACAFVSVVLFTSIAPKRVLSLDLPQSPHLLGMHGISLLPMNRIAVSSTVANSITLYQLPLRGTRTGIISHICPPGMSELYHRVLFVRSGATVYRTPTTSFNVWKMLPFDCRVICFGSLILNLHITVITCFVLPTGVSHVETVINYQMGGGGVI